MVARNITLLPNNMLSPSELELTVVRDPLIVRSDMTVMEAIAQMSDVQATYVLVVEDRQLLGIFTERDIIGLSAKKCLLEQVTMGEVMISPVISLQESALTDISSTIDLLQQRHIRHLPILNEQDQVVGIITHESLQATTHQRLKEELIRRQHNEAILLQSEQRYATLTAAVPVGIFRTDVMGNCLYVNDRWCQIAGITPEAAIGAGWQQRLYPEDRDMITAKWMQSVQENRPFALEYRFQSPDGKVTWVYGQSVLETDTDGQVMGYIGTITDISKQQAALQERQQAEEALKKSEAHQRALMSAIPDLMMRIDRDGVYLDFIASSYKFRILGTPSEMVGNNLFATMPPHLAQQRLDNIHLALATKTIQIYEQEFPVDHGIQTEEVRVVPYSEDEVLVLVQEISEQQAALQERKQAEAALIQSEAQNRAILQAIPDLMFRMGADGVYRGFVTVDREVNILIFDPTGLSVVDVLPPEIAQRHLYYLEQALATGELQVYEQQIQIGDRLQDEEVRVVKNGEDEALFIIRDISEQQAALRQLKHAEQKLLELNQELEIKVSERIQELFQVSSLQQAILNGADYSIISTDIKGVIQTFNAAAERMLGYEAAEVVGKLTLEIIHDRQEMSDRAASLSAALGQEIPPGSEVFVPQAIQDILTEEEWTYIRKDGSRFPVVLSLTALKGSQQQIIGFLGIAKDITERKRAEAKLQKVSDRLALSLKSGAIGCWEWDITQNIVLWDARMYELYGMTKTNNDCLDYDIWAKRLHPEDQILTETLHHQAILGQAEYNTEFRIVHPDNSIHFIKAYGILMRDGQGEAHSIIGINFDITDRKLAEETIRSQTEKEILLREITQKIRQSLDLQIIFDTACEEIRQVIKADRVGIFKFHPDSNFNDGEFVAESLVEGYPSVMQIRVHDYCFGENYATFYAQGRFFVANDIYNHGMSPCHIDILSQFQVRASIVIPLLCGHELWGLLCIHQCEEVRSWQQDEVNFTQQLANQLAIAIQQASLFKQLQQQLLERQQAETQLTETNQQLAISNDELARATRLKDEFLANMSHELRTPLNAILGMTEGLEDEVFGSVNQRQIKALKTIERSGSHLLELINDILDVAKIESGQFELECTAVVVDHLCQSSMAFIKQQAFKKGIQFKTKLQEHLPNLLVDERRIRQVLINLLNNAVKFTPENGRISLEVTQLPPAIALVDEAPQNFLRIAIIDTGIGISPENIPKLFQPFIQIDSALNRQYNGTGLGLALVKRIVELHGGRVGLTSELGVGSCFAIELPCIYNTSQPRITSNDELVTTTSEISPGVNRSPLILLAEDNEANISTFSGYLGAKGYRIVVAKNGQEAIDLAKSHQPELILMDIQMPGMNGLEAIEQIRLESNFDNIPIIALTALTMPGDRERCLAAGANEYLSKPVSLKQLVITIENSLALLNR